MSFHLSATTTLPKILPDLLPWAPVDLMNSQSPVFQMDPLPPAPVDNLDTHSVKADFFSSPDLFTHPSNSIDAAPRLVEMLKAHDLERTPNYVFGGFCSGASLTLGMSSALLFLVTPWAILPAAVFNALGVNLMQDAGSDYIERKTARAENLFFVRNGLAIASQKASEADKLKGTPLFACETLTDLVAAKGKLVALHDLHIQPDAGITISIGLSSKSKVRRQADFASDELNYGDKSGRITLDFGFLPPDEVADLDRIYDGHVSLIGRVTENGNTVKVLGYRPSRDIVIENSPESDNDDPSESINRS